MHWPYCARVCPYCDFNVYRARGREAEAEKLGEALLLDLATQAAPLGPRRLTSIHFGGGTPSLMPPGLIARLIDTATTLFPPAEDLEIGLEANPLESARFADLRAAGVERLSVGLQSLDDAALRTLGRDHDSGVGLAALDVAVRLFPRVSTDLIYGRPGQTPDAWRAELAAVAARPIGHVSAYQLTYEPETAFGRAAARGALAPPCDDLSAVFYEATADVLGAAGFDAYEVSNWARDPTGRSRHNLGYWRGVDYLGVGPGAHGRLTVDGVRRATAGRRRVPDYLRAVSETGAGLDENVVLSPREVAEERAILGLRIDEGVLFDELEPLWRAGHKVLELSADGLLNFDHGRVRATPRGRQLLDSVVRTLTL